MPATTFSDMPTLATSRPPTTSPPFHRRRKSWARKIERCCCMTFTHLPLVFVYGLTTWAVYVQVDVCFLGRYDWLAFLKAGLAIVLYLLADLSYTMAVFTNPGSTLDSRRSSRRRMGRRKEGGYEGLPMHEDEDDEEEADTAVPREWMSAVTAKSTGKPRYCKKCQAVKPDRAHHCSTCGRCVLKMDHHCPWLATCVGLRNYKAFLLFLTYVSLFCLVCFASTALWVWVEIFDAHPMDSGLHVVNIIMLAVLSGIIGLVLSGFAGWHYYLTLTAQTTIESLEKTRYLTGLRKTLEPSPQSGRQNLSGGSAAAADYEASAAEDQPLAERLKVIHANALPGVLRPEEGEISGTPSPQPSRTSSAAPHSRADAYNPHRPTAHGSLRRSFATLEAQRERDRYNLYLDERDSETLPNAFNHGWRRNFVHVFGDRPLLWPLPLCTTSGDGWMWEVSPQWTAARDRKAREREERERNNAMWDQHSGQTYRGPPPPPPPPPQQERPNWRWNGGAGFVDQYGNAPTVSVTPPPPAPQQQQEQQPPSAPPLASSQKSGPAGGGVPMLPLDRRKAASPSGKEGGTRGRPESATANWNDVPDDFLARKTNGSSGERGTNGSRRKGE